MLGALPDDVDVPAAVLLVEDDGARLTGQAKFFLEGIDGLAPLIGRHRVAGIGIDVRVIEAFVAAGAFGRSCQSRKASTRSAVGGLELDTPTRSFVGSVRCRWRASWAGGTGAAFDDHGIRCRARDLPRA